MFAANPFVAYIRIDIIGYPIRISMLVNKLQKTTSPPPIPTSMKSIFIGSLQAALLLVSTQSLQAVVYIDSFSQTWVDHLTVPSGVTLNASTENTQLSDEVYHTLTTGSPAAISTNRTVHVSIPAPFAFAEGEIASTEVELNSGLLRMSNSLFGDKADAPLYTISKVGWDNISGSNQELMSNTGASSGAQIQFLVRVSGSSYRNASYTSHQYFDITLKDTANRFAGYRGFITSEQIAGSEFTDVVLDFVSASGGFDFNGITSINMEVQLPFTEGSTNNGIAEENVLLVNQITAIPEASAALLGVLSLGLSLIRRRR